MKDQGQGRCEQERDRVVEQKRDADLEQSQREIHRVPGKTVRSAADNRRGRLGRMHIRSGNFHLPHRRDSQKRRHDKEGDADAARDRARQNRNRNTANEKMDD